MLHSKTETQETNKILLRKLLLKREAMTESTCFVCIKDTMVSEFQIRRVNYKPYMHMQKISFGYRKLDLLYASRPAPTRTAVFSV